MGPDRTSDAETVVASGGPDGEESSSEIAPAGLEAFMAARRRLLREFTEDTRRRLEADQTLGGQLPRPTSAASSTSPLPNPTRTGSRKPASGSASTSSSPWQRSRAPTRFASRSSRRPPALISARPKSGSANSRPGAISATAASSRRTRNWKTCTCMRRGHATTRKLN